MSAEMFNSTEWKLLTTLENEINNGHFTTGSLSTCIFSRVLPFNVLNQSQRECVPWILENNVQLLPMAAKYGKTGLVRILMECGIPVNTLGLDGKSAIENAFKNQDSKTMWVLLQNESNFPPQYIPSVSLPVRDEYSEKINALAIRNNELHRLIGEGNLMKIQNLGLKKKSKYLSTVNQSALYTAFDCKQYGIYAYLKCTGAQFRDEAEKSHILGALDKTAKRKLEIEMVKYFQPVENAHVYYLMSKSRSQKPTSNLFRKLEYYYFKLDQIPEISHILKVVQYAEYLDIVFDFDECDISDMCPTFSQTDTILGLTKYLEGRIYIGAGGSEKATLGTLAHELTHLAMDIVYRNGGNPYGEHMNESKNYFSTYGRFPEGKHLPKENSKALSIFLYAGSRSDIERDSELIPRLTQILVEVENGRSWLETNPISQRIFRYFQTNILKECYEFTQNSYFTMEINYSNLLRNQSKYELQRLQSFNVLCKNVDGVKNLLKDDRKRLFIYKVESTTLGLFKVLQGALGTNYLKSSDDYLLLRLECFLFLPEDFTKKIYSEPETTVIFEGNDCLDSMDLVKICNFISSIPNKIIFVVSESVAENLKIGLKKYNLDQQQEEMTDDQLTLFDFDEESQSRILERKIVFQGRETRLGNLIGKDMYKNIKPDFIDDLLKGNKVEIGGEMFGVSSMEGAYGDVLLDLNLDSFKDALQTSDIIFVIEDKYSEKYGNEKMIQYFKVFVDEDKIYIHNSKKFQKLKHRIVLADRFFDADFQAFCHDNEEQMIYWIKIKDLNADSFRVQKFYDPYFYVKRKVKKVVKICLDESKMHEMINKNPFDTFIITGGEEKSWGSILKRLQNAKFLNVKDANIEYLKLTNEKYPVHWLEKAGEELIWKKSSKSIRNLRPYILKDGTQTTLIEESDLVADIVNDKVLIIADYPGMGKSTTLTRLYTAESIAADHWIIRINLRTHWKKIDDEIRRTHKITFETVIRILSQIEPVFKNLLNVTLLESVYQKKGDPAKSLLIAFDSFDEILDVDSRLNIIKFLKFLTYDTPCKVWITTRLHHKESLENELSTFAVELEPFDDKAKKTFIKKYFNRKLKLSLDVSTYREIFTGKGNAEKGGNKISVYTKLLVKRMKDIFLEDIAKFIGTPLQLNLVLCGSSPHFKNWVENNESVPNFQNLGRNLVEVYKLFIERKYRIYFEKMNHSETLVRNCERVLIEDFHNQLAESLILKGKVVEKNHRGTEMALMVGIVQSQDSECFEFVHLTFREFYCAQIYLNYLNKRLRDEPDSYDSELEAFLFNEILEKREYELIRRFIDVGLGVFPRSKISQNVCQEFALNFYKKGNFFHRIAEEGCQNLFCIFFFACKWIMTPKKILRLKDDNGITLIYSIIKSRNRLMLHILCQEMKKLRRKQRERIIFNKNQKWHGSILHLAQMFSTFELFKLVLNEANEILDPDKVKTLLFATNCVRETILHQACLACDRFAVLYILHTAKQLLSRAEFKNFLLRKDARGRKACDLLPMALSLSEIGSI